MNLYHLEQSTVTGWDTYSDCVVVAENEEKAKEMSPSDYYKFHDDAWHFQYADGTEKQETRDDWAHPKDIQATLIGEAIPSIKEGVICASFHAG